MGPTSKSATQIKPLDWAVRKVRAFHDLPPAPPAAFWPRLKRPGGGGGRSGRVAGRGGFEARDSFFFLGGVVERDTKKDATHLRHRLFFLSHTVTHTQASLQSVRKVSHQQPGQIEVGCWGTVLVNRRGYEPFWCFAVGFG